MREYVDNYEKLEAKVADNEVYITEQKAQAEEQKQIITG